MAAMHAGRGRAPLVALAAAGVLVVVAPGPTDALAALAAPGAAGDPAAPLLALLALLAWTCAAYLLLAAALTAMGRVPGAAGALARSLARRTVPAGLRHALAAALGAGLVVGVAGGAAAAPASTTSGWAATAAPAAAGAPGGTAAPELPPLDHPLPPQRPPGDDLTSVVIVEPGDCLWSLAQERLGPGATTAEVAAAWPRWWQANREVVGENPDLILPGMRLQPPDHR